jgi:arylsulfatase A-like enzyme
VPLLVKRPGAAGGSMVDGVVSQVDVFATFLEAAGAKLETPWARSLFAHRDESALPALSEFLATPGRGGASLEIALRRGDLKYMARYRASSIEEVYASPPREEELYDLDGDPGERRNLLSVREAEMAEWRDAVKRYLELAHEGSTRFAEGEVELDPALRRELESLGYIEH